MAKVLHIIQGYGGGISSIVKNLILSADPDSLQQDVMSFAYTHGEAFVAELERRGSHCFQMPRPRKQGMKAFRQYVKKVLREGKYDVVHCHSDGWRAFLFRSIAKAEHVPLFCIHAHRASNEPGTLGANPAYIRINQWISRKCADVCFACGREAAEFIYGTANGTITIPNGIDPVRCANAAKVDADSLRASLGVEKDALMLLQVGRIVVQKNYDFTLKIAEELKNRGVCFKILIVGAGDLEEELRKKIQQKSLLDVVVVLGRRSDVYELMAAADAMLLPSLWEGLPTVAVEAQAMGLHSLLSDKITQECDMGLGLVDFLPIDTAASWVDSVCNIRCLPAAAQDECLEELERRAYTAKSSVQRYIDTLARYLQN